MFTERITRKLNEQQRAGLYRNPPEIRKRAGKYLHTSKGKLLNFASNDYLGLGASPELREKTARNFEKYGASASSSRLVSAHYNTITEAECAFAEYFGYEAALFWPSGYQANLGLISTIPEKGDTIVFDKHIHASSVKGMVMSGAAFYGYRHNNMDHLEKRLEKCGASPTVVLTESLFSMDGDFLNVEGIREFRKKYGFLSIVDEAHAFGAVGEKGRGIARDAADVALGTFGKAFGLFGAFVLVPGLFREFLLNFASPVIYTTSLPEAHGASAMDALDLIARSDDRRERLQTVSRRMKESLEQEGFQVNGDAHILALAVGDESRSVMLARQLFEQGIFTFPARFPTVPLGQAILRISMTAEHTEEDVNRFVRTLKDVSCDIHQ